MLVITRGLYQTFKVGDDVTIKVCGLNRGKNEDTGREWFSVNIGIDAPPHVRVERDDLKKRPKSK